MEAGVAAELGFDQPGDGHGVLGEGLSIVASSGGLYAGAFPLLLIALISVRERDAAATGLGASGARRGIAGMRERVDGCGGQLTAGPTAAGGRQVAAVCP
jgi:hypothetical protein